MTVLRQKGRECRDGKEREQGLKRFLHKSMSPDLSNSTPTRSC